jgi:hypothetical protein
VRFFRAPLHDAHISSQYRLLRYTQPVNSSKYSKMRNRFRCYFEWNLLGRQTYRCAFCATLMNLLETLFCKEISAVSGLSPLPQKLVLAKVCFSERLGVLDILGVTSFGRNQIGLVLQCSCLLSIPPINTAKTTGRMMRYSHGMTMWWRADLGAAGGSNDVVSFFLRFFWKHKCFVLFCQHRKMQDRN